MSDVEHNSSDSPQPMDIIKAAETAIKSLDDNTPPPIIELLTTFLREVEKYHKGKSTASSSEVSSNENQQEKKVGKIKVLLSKEIGRSANGTIVFEGYYEVREVAVKRLLKSHFDRNLEAEREMKNLITSDRSQNIVTYYGTEEDYNFIYLALERCDCNLDNLIQMYPKNSSQHEPLSKDFEKLKNTKLRDIKLWNENTCRPSPLLQKLMSDMVSGLVALHKSRIVHRDLKPQNILIIQDSPTLCAKLAEMGISRQLRGNKLSLTDHKSSVCAATGWKAPEQLLHGQQTAAMDLFSLGCILFFSITGGEHPFGNDDDRDQNIKNKAYKPDWFLIKDFPEAVDLISSLIKFEAGERPQANKVLHHPLFWDAKKRLEFLCHTGDCLKEESTLSDDKKTALLRRLEPTANKIVGKNGWGKVRWDKKILNDKIKKDHPNFLCGYKFGSVKHLLLFIRNKYAHYVHDPEEIQKHFGTQDEGFGDYFTSRFPMLFFEVYNVVRDCCKDDVLFKAYFEGGS
ncbi:serine/threonine-protein kinase/endoribonuclease IRE1b [Morus notabilis]|uniref:serine/threonine-protein kinase/endoribonuclease IRE1b n=1 Tax=Morus notabilis TaxID=981085 RepID=UPI000CED5269|nr:serine/threonine-protein kinase/endoribonuclease IRE1b [Morus notabilis]